MPMDGEPHPCWVPEGTQTPLTFPERCAMVLCWPPRDPAYTAGTLLAQPAQDKRFAWPGTVALVLSGVLSLKGAARPALGPDLGHLSRPPGLLPLTTLWPSPLMPAESGLP